MASLLLGAPAHVHLNYKKGWFLNMYRLVHLNGIVRGEVLEPGALNALLDTLDLWKESRRRQRPAPVSMSLAVASS